MRWPVIPLVRPPRCPLALPLAVLPLALAACGPDEPPAAAGSRAEASNAQIQAASEQLGPWSRWLDDLERMDPHDHCGEALCVRWGSQRLIWDAELGERLADPEQLAEPAADRGPLVTIVDFGRQLDELGIDLLVVVVPPAAAVYPELVGDAAPLLPGETPPGETPPLLDAHLRRFYAVLEEAGVEVIDLLPRFLERRYGEPIPGAPGPGRELLFQWQDPHWTSYGAAVAAEVVAERVRRYPWFEEAAAAQGQAHWTETSTWVEEHGTIARRMLESGRLEPGLPPDRWRRITVRIEGERWSFDDRQSPIVLLGDSFSRRGFGFPDQLLRHFGFRVDSLVVAGGLPTAALDTLRFRGDRLAGKRLVIWEMTAYALQSLDRWHPVDVTADSSS